MYNYLIEYPVCMGISAEKEELLHTRSCRAWLNQQALHHGTSFQGARESFKYLTSARKRIPVCISQNPLQLYFPLSSQKDAGNIWVNYARLAKVSGDKTGCVMHFEDGQKLSFDKPRQIQHTLSLIFLFLARLNEENTSPKGR